MIAARSCLALALLTSCKGAQGCERTTCGPLERSEGGRCVAMRFEAMTSLDGIGEPAALAPTLTLDGEGRILAAWEAGETPALMLFEESAPRSLSRVDPSTRTPPSEPRMDPVLATLQGKRALVGWRNQTADGRGLLHVAERDERGRWDTVPIYDPTRETSGSLRLACNRKGRCVAAWVTAERPDSSVLGLAMAERDAPGAPWRGPARPDDTISTHRLFVDGPEIRIDDAGRLLATWYQAGHHGRNLLATYMTERITPPDRPKAPAPDDFLSHPELETSGNRPGGAVLPVLGPGRRAAVLWVQETSTGMAKKDAPRAVYLALADEHGTWTRPTGLSDALTSIPGDAFAPVATFLDDGSLLVAWQANLSNGRIFGVALPPGSRTPPAPAQLLSRADRSALQPSLASSPGRGAVLAWSEHAPGTPSSVMCRAYDARKAAWSPPVRLSPEDGIASEMPSVAVDRDSRRVAIAYRRGPFPKTRVVIGAFE